MTTSEITLRQAVPADCDALRDLIQTAMAVYAEESGIPGPLDAQRESDAELCRHIETDVVLVAEHHGRLIGTVRLVRHDASTVYFSRFAVLPALRHSGVGRLLFDEAERRMKADGFSRCFLHTALSNDRLVRFYETHGFRRVETSHDRGYARGLFIKNLRGDLP